MSFKTTRRLGKSVFKLDREIWEECRKCKIDDDVIRKYHAELWGMDVQVSYNLAAAMALRDLKKRVHP